MIYTKEAIEKYALYHAVKLIDVDNIEYNGWLVLKDNNYMILPIYDLGQKSIFEGNRYIFKRSHIKAIYHLTNGVLIPKKFKG